MSIVQHLSSLPAIVSRRTFLFLIFMFRVLSVALIPYLSLQLNSHSATGLVHRLISDIETWKWYQSVCLSLSVCVCLAVMYTTSTSLPPSPSLPHVSSSLLLLFFFNPLSVSPLSQFIIDLTFILSCVPSLVILCRSVSVPASVNVSVSHSISHSPAS